MLLNETFLHQKNSKEVMKETDCDRQTLLRAFYYLVKHDNEGMPSLTNSAKHQSMSVEGFCKKVVEDESS